MRNGFEHYIKPRADEYASIWDSALFVFDANVLLDLYRYTKASRESLLECLSGLSGQSWLPHQVVDEFHRNRASVVHSNEAELQPLFNAIGGALSGDGKKSKRPEQSIVGQLTQRGVAGLEKLLNELRSELDEHVIDLDADPILPVLEKVFEGRIGPPFTDEQMKKHLDTAKDRFGRSVPPGYLDQKSKPEPERYGDVIVWLQILDKVAETRKPVVYVTGEDDDDWWQIAKGKKVGPRNELCKEMREVSGQPFVMYNVANFLGFYNFRQSKPIPEAVIQEVKDVAARPTQKSVLLEALEGRHLVEPAYKVGSLASTIANAGSTPTPKPYRLSDYLPLLNYNPAEYKPPFSGITLDHLKPPIPGLNLGDVEPSPHEAARIAKIVGSEPSLLDAAREYMRFVDSMKSITPLGWLAIPPSVDPRLVDAMRSLTDLGRSIDRLPVDPRLSEFARQKADYENSLRSVAGQPPETDER